MSKDNPGDKSAKDSHYATLRRAHRDAKRERGEWTVPTTVGVERRFNPFVRAADAADFAARRAAKDGFRG